MAAAHGGRGGRRRLSHILLLCLVFLLPLVGEEFTVRALIAAGRLPVAPAHTPEFEITWTNLSRLPRPPDVLILGDSVSQQGIEPAVLGGLLRTAVGRPVSVFNAASPGGTVGVNWAIVNELAREGRLPRVAIVGLYPGTLKNDLTYSQFFGITPMGGLFGGCELTKDLGTRLDCELSTISAAWRWRGRPMTILSALRSPMPQATSSGGLRLRADGFRAGRGRTVEQIHGQLESADLKRRLFVFPQVVSDGYVRLINTLRANGVAIVPVAIPDSPLLNERMSALEGTDRRQQFRDALDVLASRSGIPFVDPVAFGAWWGDGQARNFNHLSASGARYFTRQLWGMADFRDALISALR